MEQMEKKLRRQFVTTAGIALTIVLVFVLGLINSFSYASVLRNQYAILNYLTERDGVLSEEEDPDHFGDSDVTGDEMPYRLRFFSIRTDENGQVTETDLRRIHSVTDEECVLFAAEILTSWRDTGLLKDGRNIYAWKREARDSGSFLMFLDCTSEYRQAGRFFRFSLLFGILTELLVLCIIALLSGRAVEPMVRSLESRKRFITNAGHELKTPIAVISANAEVLEMMNGESEWTSSILNQVRRLTHLVNELIILAKMGEETKLTLSDQDLSAAVREAADSFRTVAEQAGKQLKTDIADQVHVSATSRELPELVNILVDNAVKYCDDGGTVEVALARRSGDKGAVLTVRNDNDAGQATDHDRFFDRFYRGDESHNSGKEGHGIGLAMAAEIVRLYRGKIRAEWKDGKTVFTVTFP